MDKIRKVIWALILGHFIFISSVCYGDEADLFTSVVEPDATIILDLSGSMGYTSWGGNTYISGTDCTFNGPFYPTSSTSHPNVCYFNQSTSPMRQIDTPIYGNTNCTGTSGFYRTSGTGHTTPCSRLAIAQRAIFSLLDYNGDGIINSADRTAMKVRMAYMAFPACNVTSCEAWDEFGYPTPSPLSSCSDLCVQLYKPLDSPSRSASYSSIYCNNATQCSVSTTCSSNTQCVNYGLRAGAGTADVAALADVKLYYDWTKSPTGGNDPAAGCRSKFVILVTDGADTYGCFHATGALGGNSWDFHPQQYARRVQSVARAKALKDAGYTLFVVGLGNNLTGYEKNTVEWMAYYGGMDNPNTANSGNVGNVIPPTPPGTCVFDSNESVNASGMATMGPNTTCIDWDQYSGTPSTIVACEPSINNPPLGGVDNCFCYGKSNDPGDFIHNPLSGYAYFTGNATSLATALQQSLSVIQQSIYSFSVTSVAAARISAEDYLYEASFTPMNNTPLWKGHLTKSNINSDGTVGTQVWDAGSKLHDLVSNTGYANRKIFTLISGAVTAFSDTSSPWTVPGQAKTYLGVGDATQVAPIIGYILGNPTYDPDGWYLGDIFHSIPIAIASPSAYFMDPLDQSNPNAFTQFRTNHQRTSASGTLLVVAGANDGQFHAFKGSDGSEKWSFIPPNLLPKLQFIAHSALPSALSHQYMVDGPVSASDVWLGSGTGTSKSSSDWHTLLVFGEGKGVRAAKPWNSKQDCTGNSSLTYDATNYPYLCDAYAWSSSQYCDSNYNNTYTTSYPYYCGYYALDVTDTSATQPILPFNRPWLLTPDSSTAPYLGEPWSKMAIGRVIIGGNEQWVGFIGAGYPSDSGNTGRGFFVVNLSDGSILWSFTKANNGSMTYGIPASPAIVDTDNDGFIDTAYVGDLGGNVWRLKFCTKADTSSCNKGNWSGSLLFQASSGLPIYSSATVARDTNSLWVLWGTGDRENPLSTSGQNSFFAVQDTDRTATYNIGSLQNISASQTLYNGTSSGWYINFSGTGEKDLRDPTIYGGIALFTTYTPDPSASNLCNRIGSSSLYAIAIMPITINGITYNAGAGVLSPGSTGTTTGGNRSTSLGSLGVGMATAPVVSQNLAGSSPGTNVYITLSGGADHDANVITTTQLGGNVPLNIRLQGTGISTQIIHWRDGRLQ